MRVKPEAEYVLDVGREVVVDGEKRFVPLRDGIPLDPQMLRMMGARLAGATRNLAPGESRRVDFAVQLVRSHPETGVLPRRGGPEGGAEPVSFGGDLVVDPVAIVGRWTAGVALDLHTTRSIYLGQDEEGRSLFDTASPDLGRLMHDLKWLGHQPAALGIVAAAVHVLEPHRAEFDVVVPAPPSEPRDIQPVTVIANGIAAGLRLPVADCVARTRRTRPFKGLTDAEKLQELAGGVFAADPNAVRGKRVLLVDDIVESGATLNALADVLLGQGGAGAVYVMAVTKARNGSCPTG